MVHRGQGYRGTRLALLVAVLMTAIGAGAIAGIAHPKTAFACPSIARSNMLPQCANFVWPYAHSWYITNIGSGAMTALADKDYPWVNHACANNTNPTDFMTILDFGRPGEHNGSYGLYSAFINNGNGGWMPYSQVEQLAEQYATEWFGLTTSCPRLHLVIGTGNDYECQGSDSGCNIYTAGQQFDAMVHNVQSYINAQGWGWQETVWGGDDLEAEWDQWSMTSSFINGVYAQDKTYSSHAYLIDYGDANIEYADIQGNYWTYQNVYDASWGVGYDYPLPEIYGNTQGPGDITQWVNMYNSGSVNRYAGQLVFEGNIAECSEADTLPTGNCWTGNYRCEYSPESGYNLLAQDVSQSAMPYTTNIQWQGSSTTGNNNC
jgi:hypothetical protein